MAGTLAAGQGTTGPAAATLTQSGTAHLDRTVADYRTLLLDRAVKVAEESKGPESPTEVTYDHVRRAAHVIAAQFGAPVTPTRFVVAQVFEYVCTATAGVMAGHLDKGGWAIAGFGVSTAIGVVLVAWRLSRNAG